MTPADETTFIALWQQGASQQELAQRLGVPIGTIKSRASALARQGKIQARPKGGAYPRQRHQADLAGVSPDTSGVSTRRCQINLPTCTVTVIRAILAA
jgi:transposase